MKICIHLKISWQFDSFFVQQWEVNRKHAEKTRPFPGHSSISKKIINSWQTDRVLPDLCGSSDATFIGDSHSSAQSGQIKADTAATLTIFQFETHVSAQTDWCIKCILQQPMTNILTMNKSGIPLSIYFIRMHWLYDVDGECVYVLYERQLLKKEQNTCTLKIFIFLFYLSKHSHVFFLWKVVVTTDLCHNLCHTKWQTLQMLAEN